MRLPTDHEHATIQRLERMLKAERIARIAFEDADERLREIAEVWEEHFDEKGSAGEDAHSMLKDIRGLLSWLGKRKAEYERARLGLAKK